MTFKILARQNYAQDAYELYKLSGNVFDYFYAFFCVFDRDVEMRVVSNILRVKHIPISGDFPTERQEFRRLPGASVGPIQMFEFAAPEDGSEHMFDQPTYYPGKWNFDKTRSLKTGKICFYQMGSGICDIAQAVAVEADDIQKVSIRMIPINPFPHANLNNDAKAILLHRPGGDHVTMSGRIWNREWFIAQMKKLMDNLETEE